MNELICTICKSDFDIKEKMPRLLPCCGHTFCSECLEKILKINKKTFQCPFDKKEMDLDNNGVKNFPINFALRAYINQKKKKKEKKKEKKNKNKKGCKLHKMEFDLICLSDNKMICQHCALFGDHKNHDFRRIEDYCNEIFVELNQVEKSMDKTDKDIFIIDEFEKEISVKIEFKKKKIIGDIKKKFNTIRGLLDIKENIMVKNITEDFDNVLEKKIDFLTENKNIKLKKEKILKKIKKIKKYLEVNNFAANVNKIFKKNSFISSLKKIKKKISNIKKEKKNIEKIITEKKFNLDNTEILKVLEKNLFLNNDKIKLEEEKVLEIKNQSIKTLEDIKKKKRKNSFINPDQISRNFKNLEQEKEDLEYSSSSDLTKDLIFEIQETKKGKDLNIDLCSMIMEKEKLDNSDNKSEKFKIQKRQLSFTKQKLNHLSSSQKIMKSNRFPIKNNINIFSNFTKQVMSPRIQKISNHVKRYSGSFSTKNSKYMENLNRIKNNFGEERLFRKSLHIEVDKNQFEKSSNENVDSSEKKNSVFYVKNQKNESKEVLKQNNFLKYSNKVKNRMTCHAKHNSIFKFNHSLTKEFINNKILEEPGKNQYNIKNHFKTSKNKDLDLKNENNFFISKKNKKKKISIYHHERLNTNYHYEKKTEKKKKSKKKKEVCYDNLRITDSKLNHLLKLILSEDNAKSLNLNKNLITTNGFQKLLNQIINKNFERLYLKNNKIDSKALKIILTFADSMTNLKYINLEDNQIQNSCSKKYKKLLKNKGITLII